MQAPTAADDADLDALRQYGALSGPFDPAQAIAVLTGPAATDTESLLAVTARFANACDTRHAGDGSTWLMRDPERRWELDRLADGGDLAGAVRWRRTLPTDGPTEDLLDALDGTGAFSPGALTAALTDGTTRDRLEQLAVAIDRAGRTAPGRAQVDAIKAEIIRLDARRRDEVLLERGFYGREAERGDLAAWLAGPAAVMPVMALFITGLPGMGKSTLLDEAVRSATAAADAATPGRGWLTARLDFDRAGLDVQDRIGLTVELARQLAAELGDQAAALRSARLEASGFAVSNESSMKGEGRERTPVPLAQAVSTAMRAAGRPLLVILDTLEVLRGRGETHPERLFQWLDELVSFGIGPMWVLAAGRGDALDSAPARVGRRIELRGLDDVNADRLLAGLGLPPESFAAVREIAQGSPLVLRLAARVVLEVGPGALDTASRRRGVAAAYLYRFLLSRIDDPTLRALAHPGLVVRRINAEVIGQVLGPQLGIELDPAEAQRVFEVLASHHWLVEPDPAAPGFVKHRTDMRSVLLPLLYKDQPAKCDKIDRAAADWFGRRPEPWCAVESAYHRLQHMRRDHRPPLVDPQALLGLDDSAILELPAEAQTLVRQQRGERTQQFRGEAAPTANEPLDPAAARELEGIIDRGDWLEGAYVYDQTFGVSLFDPRSRDADVARTFLWRAGRWAEAKRLLDARDRLGGGDDLTRLPPPLAQVRLEMRAEFGFAALVAALRANASLLDFIGSIVLRAGRSELGDGALGFALRLVGAQLASASKSSDDIDAVGAVFATWAPAAADDGRARGALASAESRLAAYAQPSTPLASGASGTPPGPSVARALAVLSPYVRPSQTLLRAEASARARDDATGIDHALAAAAFLAPSDSGPWRVAPENPSAEVLDRISGVGLLAEWAGVAAFWTKDRDLALIARGAERWRRTAAGDWSYERAPDGGTAGWSHEPDVTIADRVAALVAALDPAAAARDELAAWCSPSRKRQTPAAIEARFATASVAARDAAPDGDPVAIARALLARQVPSAFVPALAVLASTQRPTRPDKPTG
ncbi:MAG TPA: ATP-binding protein [Candidatus Limnocylindrales bacterium]